MQYVSGQRFNEYVHEALYSIVSSSESLNVQADHVGMNRDNLSGNIALHGGRSVGQGGSSVLSLYTRADCQEYANRKNLHGVVIVSINHG